jgi:DNA-binding NtrC family response regulator
LYFRLNTVSIHIPSLIERGDDIELLFNYFAMEFSSKYQREPVELSEDAINLLYKYRWTGNVRELRNLVEKLSILVKGNLITPQILQQNLLIPDSYLPSLVNISQHSSNSLENDGGRAEENAVVLQLIYDLRKEVTELKNIVSKGFRPIRERVQSWEDELEFAEEEEESPQLQILNTPAVVIKPVVALEESLSLEKKEKPQEN